MTFSDRHPLATFFGAAAGFSGWFFEHAVGINWALTILGTLAGSSVAVLTFIRNIRDGLRQDAAERAAFARWRADQAARASAGAQDDLPFFP